jgi:hypothetical protein
VRRLFLCLFILSCFACKHKAVHGITAVCTPDSLIIKGLDGEPIDALGNDSVTTTADWQTLIPIYKMPADTSLKDYQPMQPGQYAIGGENNDEVIFKPDTPFSKGQTYFVRCYDFAQGSSLTDHILRHSKMGQHSYTDLIFKQ